MKNNKNVINKNISNICNKNKNIDPWFDWLAEERPTNLRWEFFWQ
jgi:hypothetical protein